MLTPSQFTLAEIAAQEMAEEPTTPADIALQRHFEQCDHCTEQPWDPCKIGAGLLKQWEVETIALQRQQPPKPL